MNEPFNPYAPPQASLSPQAEGGCWRDGATVVLSPDGDLPARCVKCNEPAMTPIKARKVYWHHPALYILVFFPGLLVYAIVALIVRKRATIHSGLCPDHRRRRTSGLWMSGLGSALGLALIMIGVHEDSCGLSLAFLGGLIACVLVSRILYPERIDASYVRLKGAGSAFLDSLPPFAG